MKTLKDFMERMQTDEEFAKTINEAVQARRQAGASNAYEALIPAAAEAGYEITEDELRKLQKSQAEELSEEEMGKVAGGASCLAASVVISLLAAPVVAVVTWEKGPEIFEDIKDKMRSNPEKKILEKNNSMKIRPADPL